MSRVNDVQYCQQHPNQWYTVYFGQGLRALIWIDNDQIACLYVLEMHFYPNSIRYSFKRSLQNFGNQWILDNWSTMYFNLRNIPPVHLIHFQSNGSYGYEGTIPLNTRFEGTLQGNVTVRVSNNVHFDLPCLGLTLNPMAIEYSFYSFNCVNFNPTVRYQYTSLQNQQFDSGRSVRLYLGSQSSSDQHKGFGLVHTMCAHGNVVGWNVTTLGNTIISLLSNDPFLVCVATEEYEISQWWIFSKTVTRKRRWKLVIREDQNGYFVQSIYVVNNTVDLRILLGLEQPKQDPPPKSRWDPN